MTVDWAFRREHREDDERLEEPPRRAPGKVSLTQRLAEARARTPARAPAAAPTASSAAPVQRRASSGGHEDPFGMHLLGGEPTSDAVHAAAAHGLDAPATALPHLAQIQAAFGPGHDLSTVRAHVGGAAAEASAAMGAAAYATGSDVVFARDPDLHTAAHEAAHVVQQRGGVQLKGGVGQEGDAYERHADEVADAVVRGESAAALLGELAGGGGAVAGGAVQHKKDDGHGATAAAGDAAARTAPTDTAFASPMTELATKAKAVVDAAELATLPLMKAKAIEAGTAVEGVKKAMAELAAFLHQHSGTRSRNDEAALQAAIRAALGIASSLASMSGPLRKAEVELRRSVAEVERVLRENTAREATLESPGALAAMARESLRSLAEWKAFAGERQQELPGLAASWLDAVIATTTEWAARLEHERGAAEGLARAVVDQHEIVAMVGAELRQVLKQPVSATTKDTINAYFHVLVLSVDRRQRSDAALAHARAMRRRLPLDRAAAALETGFGQGLEIGEIDAVAGRQAQAEHASLVRRHDRLEARILGGDRVSRAEIDDLVLETREYEFLHRVDLIQIQAKQLLDTLEAVGGPRTAAKVKAQRQLGELMSSLVGARRRYRDFAELDVDATPAMARARKRSALDAMEAQLAHQLAMDDHAAILRAADAVIDDQIVHQFASQLLWTLALTVSGNFVAAAARGAGEAVALRAGASLGGAGRIANVVAFAAEGTYGAVTQKYLQGDPGSFTSLLAVNVLTPFAIERVMKLARVAEQVGEGASAVAAKSQRALDQAADASNAIAHAGDEAVEAVSYAQRLERAAHKSKWVQRARGAGLALRGGVNLSAEMIVGAAVDYATRMAANAGGRAPDEQTAAEWLMQGAAMAIGRHLTVNVKAIRSRLEAISSGARSATAHLLQAADGVARDAMRLEAGGKPDGADDLLARYAELLAQEQALLEKELTDTIDGHGHRGRKELLAGLAANRRASGELRKLGAGDDGGGDEQAASSSDRDGTDVGAGRRAVEPTGTAARPEVPPPPHEPDGKHAGELPSSGRVVAPRPGLFEQIEPWTEPPGWTIKDDPVRTQRDGTRVLRTRVEIDGRHGHIERAYNPQTETLEMRNAFLAELPRWVSHERPLVDGTGTPTVTYLTLRQMHLLGARYGELTTVEMSSIQNIRAIIQLHVRRLRGEDPNTAVLSTHSVEYAETAIVQSGHRIVSAELTGDIWTHRTLGSLMESQQTGDPEVTKQHDRLLQEYGEGLVTRDSVVWMNYDIQLKTAPFYSADERAATGERQ